MSVAPGQVPPWAVKTAQEIVANEKDITKMKGKLAALAKQCGVTTTRITDALNIVALRKGNPKDPAVEALLKKYGGEP